MEYVPRDEFLARVARHGIAPDPRYAEPRCLIHLPDRPHHRFWIAPGYTREFPGFIAAMLDGLDPWATIDLWPRNRWRHASALARPEDAIFGAILRGAGVRPDFDGAVRFTPETRPELTTALFATLLFGWKTSHDYFVVPDHGRQMIQSDHHDVFHVSFAEASGIDPFVARMLAAGHPLPTDVPDPTFKRPAWMG